MRQLIAAGAAALCLAYGATDVAAEQRAEIRFAATVGQAPFRCGDRYAGIGAPAATIAPQDFRLYVTDVELIRRDGSPAPLALEQDGIWQHENVALLDFENAQGNCNGTAPTNTSVRGSVPDGDYAGLRFTIGVPESLNHADATLAPSPLNYTGLFWNWRSGYIFLRLDLESTPDDASTDPAASGFSVHLGSVGCGMGAHGGSMTAPPAMPCSTPNRPAFEFAEFDIERDTVAFDVAALLAEANLAANAEGTESGCQSMPRDLDCGAILPKLGLAFGDRAADAQSVVTRLRQ